ncbi:Cysteine desulfuration protein SufE [Pseudomonas aeruginosa]
MNPVLPEQAQEALDAFGHTASWEQRARLLLQWGERLAPLAEHERQEEHRVHGCESLVWLLGEQRDGHWRFRADSDARLIRGLLAVLLARVDGIETRELARLDLNDWFTCLGLSRQLSPSRSNGLNAVLQRMRELAGQNRRLSPLSAPAAPAGAGPGRGSGPLRSDRPSQDGRRPRPRRSPRRSSATTSIARPGAESRHPGARRKTSAG